MSGVDDKQSSETELKEQQLTKAFSLLKDCLLVLNEFSNKTVHTKNFTTYELAGKIDKYFKENYDGEV